jgi:beta-glucosidase
LYDLDRQIRPVGRAYKQLIERWQMVLPVQSVCLVVPVVLPSEYEEPWATRRREWMREYHKAEQSFRQSGGRIEPQPDD